MPSNLFDSASKKRKGFDAPVRLLPECHPQAAVDVWIDSKNRTIVLSCSKCDRTIATVETTWIPHET